MHNTEDKSIILPDHPKAAIYKKDIRGWVDINGIYYTDEQQARYSIILKSPTKRIYSVPPSIDDFPHLQVVKSCWCLLSTMSSQYRQAHLFFINFLIIIFNLQPLIVT